MTKNCIHVQPTDLSSLIPKTYRKLLKQIFPALKRCSYDCANFSFYCRILSSFSFIFHHFSSPNTDEIMVIRFCHFDCYTYLKTLLISWLTITSSSVVASSSMSSEWKVPSSKQCLNRSREVMGGEWWVVVVIDLSNSGCFQKKLFTVYL